MRFKRERSLLTPRLQRRVGTRRIRDALLRGPNDLHARSAGSSPAHSDNVVELDAVVLAPDVAEPVADITAQHERVVRGVAFQVLVGDEGEEGHRGKLDLLV